MRKMVSYCAIRLTRAKISGVYFSEARNYVVSNRLDNCHEVRKWLRCVCDQPSLREIFVSLFKELPVQTQKTCFIIFLAILVLRITALVPIASYAAITGLAFSLPLWCPRDRVGYSYNVEKKSM